MNWLRERLEVIDMGTSELSRLLEVEGFAVSRQVLDNWIRMDGEQIPVRLANVGLVAALARCLRYESTGHLLQALGYEMGCGEGVAHAMAPLVDRLRSYPDEEAAGLAAILEQMVAQWESLRKVAI